jgi:hypothetical protein
MTRRNQRLKYQVIKYKLALEIQGKACRIRALGEAAGRDRRADEAAAVIDQAFEQLKPVLGTSPPAPPWACPGPPITDT